MKKLRDPAIGCPWDIEQDFQSIASHTIEEAYEVVNAIDQNNFESKKFENFLLELVNKSQDYLIKKSNLKKLNYQNTWNNVNQKIIEIIDEN